MSDPLRISLLITSGRSLHRAEELARRQPYPGHRRVKEAGCWKCICGVGLTDAHTPGDKYIAAKAAMRQHQRELWARYCELLESPLLAQQWVHLEPPAIKTLADRFWPRVDFLTETGCWLWLGPPSYEGYGHISTEDHQTSISAHRYSYTSLIGPVPDGMALDHLCRVRLCVRPTHLEPVTPYENVQRACLSTETHCKYGHPLNPEDALKNTEKNRHRARCRICQREWQRKHKLAKKQRRANERSA